MKELLESYVLEAIELRSNAEFLGRLVAVLHADLQNELGGEALDTIYVDDLQKINMLDIKVVDGMVQLG